MRILGIDPGLTGGVALLRSVVDSEPLAETWATPTIKIDKKNNLNVPAMVSIVMDAKPDRCFIERVSAMPKQGVSSTFNFGMGFGIWLGILGTLQIPYTMVHSSRWKPAMGLRGQPKSASLLMVSQLFPSVSLPRAKDEGQAEALLIAEYGRRSMAR
jgi:crossover junction endodeoxyribonuclease RuvC